MKDIYGRNWPDDYELCNICKQPDNCGDCNHEPLTKEDVEKLILKILEGEN